MKSTGTIFLLALAVVNGFRLSSNNLDLNSTQPFITGGTNAVLGQFPSVVAISIPGPISNAFCGGVILNANHILTAARCVLTEQNTLPYPYQVTVFAGDLQINFNGPRTTISAVYVHPHYNPFKFDHNLAVLRTTTDLVPPAVPIPNLDHAQLYEDIAFDGMTCSVAGWSDNVAQPLQQFITVPILNRDTCNGLEVHLGRISETMMCAGATNQGPGVCNTNVGTGLFCEGRLAGILSTGLGCGTTLHPGVYMQVRHYLPWIREQFDRQDIPEGGTSPIPVW
ncbi:trypsin-like [Uranotaenia lowii]|uniref:trypsin-like n=1 Tax=Uranotaenia lowii TaxID=190385 RepID=UPI002478FC00|nr:trypsin-like [Uranotaenia lowii]